MVWKGVVRSESSREKTNEKALFEIFGTLLVKKGFNCTSVEMRNIPRLRRTLPTHNTIGGGGATRN